MSQKADASSGHNPRSGWPRSRPFLTLFLVVTLVVCSTGAFYSFAFMGCPCFSRPLRHVGNEEPAEIPAEPPEPVTPVPEVPPVPEIHPKDS